MIKVDLRLDRGPQLRFSSQAAWVGISGASGAGKSTLLRAIAGLEPGQGSVSVWGRALQTPERCLPAWERGVGWVPQDALLFPHLSVAENLCFGGGADRMQAVAEDLEISGLLGRQPRSLSGGERQRVALGRALLREPRILLLDEPFSALDAPLKRRVRAALKLWLQEHEVPMVLVSHSEAELAFCEERQVASAQGFQAG